MFELKKFTIEQKMVNLHKNVTKHASAGNGIPVLIKWVFKFFSINLNLIQLVIKRT